MSNGPEDPTAAVDDYIVSLKAITEWSTAFAAAQAAMPDIPKGKTANIPTKSGGSFSYSYADLPEIIKIIRPVLAKHKLAFAQSVQGADGSVLVTTRVYHTGGHVESFGPVVLPAGNDAQATGSAITYARRYALCAALGIAADEDDDAAAAQPAAQQTQTRQRRRSKPEPKPSPEKDGKGDESPAPADADAEAGGEGAPSENDGEGDASDAPPPSSDDAVGQIGQLIDDLGWNKGQALRLAREKIGKHIQNPNWAALSSDDATALVGHLRDAKGSAE